VLTASLLTWELNSKLPETDIGVESKLLGCAQCHLMSTMMSLQHIVAQLCFLKHDSMNSSLSCMYLAVQIGTVLHCVLVRLAG
jgi:hypothetical protein